MFTKEDSKVAWHDRPYVYRKKVHDGEEVSISLLWRPFNDGGRLYRLEDENAKLKDQVRKLSEGNFNSIT